MSSPPRAAEAVVERTLLAAYGALGRLIEPGLTALLRHRERRGKEDPLRRGERLGRAGLERPPGPLVWLHAASVGETNAVLPLVDALVAGGRRVLLTTGTVTSAEVAAQRLPAGASHQYAPVDTPGAVGRFLAHWRPDLAFFVESELWPGAIDALARRGVPLALVNARMSDRSFRKWRRFAPLARAVLGCIDLCLAQSEADARRLRALGARAVEVTGNLKFDVPPPPVDAAALAELRARIGDRPVFLAASTHAGEETAALAAGAQLRLAQPDLLIILAPRHPARGEAVAAEAAAAGAACARRAAGGTIDARTCVYVADTIGEMGLWFRLATLAFLGGSLVDHGGQNPIEPAKLAVPILYGPHVANFADVYAALDEAGAAVRVAAAAALAPAAAALLSQADERRRIGAAAQCCVARFSGALDRTLAALSPYLCRSEGADADRS